jgi:hypothetical protein
MIGLILAGAAFLTLAMGFIGLPRHLAEFIGSLNGEDVIAAGCSILHTGLDQTRQTQCRN